METIRNILSELGVTDSYQDICRTYFTAKLIIACNNGEGYTDTLKTSRKLHAAITGYRQVISPALSDDNAVQWAALCEALHVSGLDVDMREFFDLLAPNVVADWTGYLSNLPDQRDSTILIALIVALESSSPTCEEYARYADLCRKINLTYGAFQRCWNDVFSCALADASHTPAPCISNAMRLYHSLYIPMTDLLTDYYRLHLPKDAIAEKQATRGGRRKERTSISAEGGKSSQDIQLEQALRNIAPMKPTDVIRALFYGESRNDAALECTYLLRTFASMLDTDSKVLIVNPSPDMLIWWTLKKVACDRVTFFVADQTIAELYQNEFPEVVFGTMEDSNAYPSDYDRILLVARDLPADTVLASLQLGAPTAKVLALMPEVFLTGSRNALQQHLRSHNYHIRQVISIPTTATQSSPRKKISVYADKQWCYDYFQLLFAECDEYKTALTIQKQYYRIPYTWTNGTMSIADMRKSATMAPKTKHLNEAGTYWYSTEIQLRYTIQSDCKNRCAGRAYYRAILRPEEKHRKRGGRLSPIIEKGLRKNTEAEVVAAIEQVALDERIAGAVIADVQDYYSGRMGELSIKTMWYCLRNQLQTFHTYREDLALELFCGEDQALSVLIVGTSTTEDYEMALHSVFSGREHILKRYWQQLHMILTAAKNEGYILYNPITEHMATISRQADKRQREVRNALTKKILENDEAQRIMGYLLKIPVEERDGLWILGPLLLFAVPHLREALALRWMDFVPVCNGTYQLNVTKYLCDDGSVKSLLDKSLEAYRSVPVAPLLAELLLENKQQLMERYSLTEEQIAICPIVLKDHSILKNGTTTKSCSIQSAARRRKELIEQADIPANEVMLPDAAKGSRLTDLNNYQGNIFYSNLKYHLRHVCKMTEGELCYFLGLQAPDTFSAHYCAYDHPALQLRMVKKLARWTCQFQINQLPLAPPECRNDIASGTFDYSFRADPAHLPCLDIMLNPMDHRLSGPLTLQISSRYGLTGTIICVNNKEGNHE